MTPAELARVRRRLVAFAEAVFEPLARADQRRWGECYLRGLMLDGKRKSIQPMASRLADGNEQALQQFVSQSPWDWRPVRQRLAQQMTAVLDPDAWVVDDTGFPKYGTASVGVARQYSGTLGKVANCQVGVSIHAATDQASCPLDWRLFLPQSWDGDAERRAACHVPEQVRHRPKWQLALDMVDELGGWGLHPPVVVTDAGYGESGELRLGLEARGLAYVVQVKATISAYPEAVGQQAAPYAGRGRRPRPRYRATRSSLAQLVVAAGPAAVKTVAWREGPAAGCARGLWPCGSARPGSSCAAPPPAGSCRCVGCWPSGPKASPSRSSTGWPACPTTPRFRSWSGWPSCAGASSTTTASSKTAWALTTSRAAASAAGTTT
jgi:SRSO17 transposase